MKDDEIQKYEQFGIAAMLPGMVRAVELLQAQIDDMRARLEGLQIGNTKSAKRRGRPPAATGELTVHGTPLKPGYWASMTAEERSAEMRRRRAVQEKNKASQKAKFVERARKGGQNRWASMTVKERKAHLAAMQAGRKLNGAPTVKLEATQ